MFAVNGCGTPPDASTPVTSAAPNDRIPPAFDVTFRWTPGNIVDLPSPEGTFVRAFVESFELANAGQSVEWGYPGFVDASPSNIAQMIGVYPPAESTDQPAVGTAFFTGLRRSDDADLTRIVLCRYGYRSIRVGDGRWSSATDAPRPVEIDFRRGGRGPVTGGAGTARTPNGDVFGGWYVTRYDFSAVYPTATPDEKACADSVPDDVPIRQAAEGHEPWPAMPPSPGWSRMLPI